MMSSPPAPDLQTQGKCMVRSTFSIFKYLFLKLGESSELQPQLRLGDFFPPPEFLSELELDISAAKLFLQCRPPWHAATGQSLSTLFNLRVGNCINSSQENLSGKGETDVQALDKLQASPWCSSAGMCGGFWFCYF